MSSSKKNCRFEKAQRLPSSQSAASNNETSGSTSKKRKSAPTSEGIQVKEESVSKKRKVAATKQCNSIEERKPSSETETWAQEAIKNCQTRSSINSQPSLSTNPDTPHDSRHADYYLEEGECTPGPDLNTITTFHRYDDSTSTTAKSAKVASAKPVPKQPKLQNQTPSVGTNISKEPTSKITATQAKKLAIEPPYRISKRPGTTIKELKALYSNMAPTKRESRELVAASIKSAPAPSDPIPKKPSLSKPAPLTRYLTAVEQPDPVNKTPVQLLREEKKARLEAMQARRRAEKQEKERISKTLPSML